jgi:hypothetical protein
LRRFIPGSLPPAAAAAGSPERAAKIPQVGDGAGAAAVTTLPGMVPDSPNRHVEIDDRFMTEWIDYGLRRFADYLAKHARFAAFCERRERAAADA